MGSGRYVDLFTQATGFGPYPYQEQLAELGLPELLEVPTGAGKTAATVLSWLYRRRHHPDEGVRQSTQRRLVFVLPQRTLVEQVQGQVTQWLKQLDSTDVGVVVLMGGEEASPNEADWRTRVADDLVIIGTLDMVISRALNRGYGESRWAWPISFGLLNNDCQFVFDEIQQMGPALPTSRQLEGLRSKIGTAVPCRSTWMSATIRHDDLDTIDNPHSETADDNIIKITNADRHGTLGARLSAPKLVRELTLESQNNNRYTKDLAASVIQHHRPGTRTLVIVNTVLRAVETSQEIKKLSSAKCVLLHSRFRPRDRAKIVEQLGIGRTDSPHDDIIVATQVIEAGVDISCATLMTEAAPWASVVQRAGRCNRYAEVTDASIYWCEPPKSPPYLPEDIAATVEALRSLEETETSAEQLGQMNVEMTSIEHRVLRRRDLIGLFDTMPDLAGHDIDVGPYIRPADDLDAAVAWRRDDKTWTTRLPDRDERCSVPIRDLKDEIGKRKMWRLDPVEERWVRTQSIQDIRPGMVVILDAQEGGYTAESGWTPKSKRVVEPLDNINGPAEPTENDDVISADPLSTRNQSWYELSQHLLDVERETQTIIDSLHGVDLPPGAPDAAVHAGLLHDIGKSAPAFQAMLQSRAANDTETLDAKRFTLLAKSGGSQHAKRRESGLPQYFRHELASALTLLGDANDLIKDSPEPDLTVYLVAAHHGRVRLGVRPLPKESTSGRVLGIADDDQLMEILIEERPTVPPSTLKLDVVQAGTHENPRSWTERALALRDRNDIGVFRLGFLEAIVRMGDWKASALTATKPSSESNIPAETP